VWRRRRAFFGLAAYRLETSEKTRHGSPLLAGRIEGEAFRAKGHFWQEDVSDKGRALLR
jgi:hypothetical protein